MAGIRRDYAERTLDEDLYPPVDPVKAFLLAEERSFDIAAERYGWLDRKRVGRLIEQGRALTYNCRNPRNARRTICRKTEVAIVAAVFTLGSVSRAGRVHGVSDTLVTALLREHGYREWPRASRKAASVAQGRALVAAYLADHPHLANGMRSLATASAMFPGIENRVG